MGHGITSQRSNFQLGIFGPENFPNLQKSTFPGFSEPKFSVFGSHVFVIFILCHFLQFHDAPVKLLTFKVTANLTDSGQAEVKLVDPSEVKFLERQFALCKSSHFGCHFTLVKSLTAGGQPTKLLTLEGILFQNDRQ